MHRLLVALVLAVNLAAWSSSAAGSTAVRPQMGSTVVFLHYKDIDSAIQFYEEVLGLKQTFDNDKIGIKMYRLTEHSSLCLIDVNKDTLANYKPPTSAVKFGIQTDQLDEWYQWLAANKATLKAKFKSELADSFEVKDPGGYSFEFFQLNKQ